MQDHSSFDARHNMGSNPENRFCRLSVHCAAHRAQEGECRPILVVIQPMLSRFLNLH